MIHKYNIIKLINDMPNDIVLYLKEFIPNKYFIFTNKSFYIKYHYLIKEQLIPKYNIERYIRDMICRDNEFVLQRLLYENYNLWNNNNEYYYKNASYLNYLHFLINFCIIHDSYKCKKILVNYIFQ